MSQPKPDALATESAASLAPSSAALAKQLQASQTIEAAYGVWRECVRGAGEFNSRIAEQRRRLSQQGEFLVGTVAAARGSPAGESRPSDGLLKLDAFMGEAQAQLDAAVAALSRDEALGTDAWRQATETARGEVELRVDRSLQLAPPKIELTVRLLAGSRRILHLRRLSPDDAVRLCRLWLQRVPTRYEFLLDDTTDDHTRAPPTLYADGAVPAGSVRPTAVELKALLEREPVAVPLKACLVQPLSERVVRWCSRGPVLEAEIDDGERFRNLLSSEEAEAIAGALLRQKLEGRIELELKTE